MYLKTRKLRLSKDTAIKLAGTVVLLTENQIKKLYADIISSDAWNYLYAKNSPLLKKILEALEAALFLRIRERLDKELFPAETD